MKFDTSNKKPNTVSIAVMSAIVAAFILILILTGYQKHVIYISLVCDIYFALVAFFMLRAFIVQIHYNPYSYNSIYYMGFGLFMLFIFISWLRMTFAIVSNVDIYINSAINILSMMAASAQTYMFISIPFVFIYSIFLIVSNIVLIKKEGKRFSNFLGILLALVLMAGEMFIYVNGNFSGSEFEMRIHEMIANSLAAIYLYFECMIIGAIIVNSMTARYEPRYNKDFIIILGCAIRDDGTPLPLLKGRIDRALEFRNKQKEETGKDLIFITSGGQGKNEVISESASMKKYLMDQGVPESRIIEENQSENTYQNMKFSKEKIDAVNPDGKIAFATTNYHVFRSGIFARAVNMRAVGMGAKTKTYFWPNALVREIIGLLAAQKKKQGIIIICMIAIYMVLTLVAYRY